VRNRSNSASSPNDPSREVFANLAITFRELREHDEQREADRAAAMRDRPGTPMPDREIGIGDDSDRSPRPSLE
jgi:hypothetical protein